MGIIKGLGAINKYVEAEDAKYNGGGDKASTKWFKILDKQSVKVVFLQELDADSENYSQKNGLGFLAVEHTNPNNWRKKALCTIDDEGVCFACEQHSKDWKAGWKQKSRFYVNVLVDENNGTAPYVAVLAQGNGPKSITPTLIEYAGDDGTISDRYFNVKRTGSGATDTSYTLRAGKEHGLNVEDYDLFDLEEAVRQIPYAEQEAFYRDGEEVPAPTVSSSASEDSSTSSEVPW